MLPRPIHLLPDNLIHQIAAGEVVERPASVVKELVENAIDAGAQKITIEIKQAGKKLIRVSDDGGGIAKADLPLALAHHATSKINHEQDLFAITTLGFRGEALSSIASVSRLEMFSLQAGEKIGAKITFEGGSQVEFCDFGCPPGTTVEVKNLFFNTPARRKFLKGDATEAFHIFDFISNMVLAYPGIAFKLIEDGKEALVSLGSGKHADAMGCVFGANWAGQFLPVSGEGIFGFVSSPTISRMDRKAQSFFVNGRSIKSFLLSRALEDGLQNVIPRGRYPLAVIFLTLDPKEIDVNVHPAKREIKFAKQAEVLASLRKAILEAVGSRSFLPCQRFENQADVSVTENNGPGEHLGSEFDFRLNEGLPPGEKKVGFDFSASTKDTLEIAHEITQDLPYFPLCQIDRTYIIAVNPKEMVIIDQHAAHERILFDVLQHRGVDRLLPRQRLLLPEKINLSKTETKLLENLIDYLETVGFEIESFGKETFTIRAVPAFLGEVGAEALIKDILAEAASESQINRRAERDDKILKMLACKGAVRAGQKMSSAEMQNLIRDLFSTAWPQTCPHGRPTLVKYGIDSLEKMFKRRGF